VVLQKRDEFIDRLVAFTTSKFPPGLVNHDEGRGGEDSEATGRLAMAVDIQTHGHKSR